MRHRTMPRGRHAFLVNALHQPFAATCLPGNAPHGPDALPGLPWYSIHAAQSWPAAYFGYFALSTFVASAL